MENGVVGGLEDKRVMVTGADGFIGSHLVERLLEEAATVRAFCMYNSHGSCGWLDELDQPRLDGLEFRLGDVRDPRSVRLATEGVDVVFHLAALMANPVTYIAPESFIETNVAGTLNVLESIREAGDVRLVQASTSEVCGTPESVPVTESHRLWGQTLYAASKIAADHMCQAYAHLYDVDVLTLRPFATYGPRQADTATVPMILKQLLAGVTAVRLPSTPTRLDLTYVSDTVDAFIRMATSAMPPGHVIHIGSGQAVSMDELFRLCCEITGREAEPVAEYEGPWPPSGDAKGLISEPSRAQSELGWHATYPLHDGVTETVRWLADRPRSREAPSHVH